MRIGVDVSGGDNAPHEILKGSFDALPRLGEDDVLVLAGDQAEPEHREAGEPALQSALSNSPTESVPLQSLSMDLNTSTASAGDTLWMWRRLSIVMNSSKSAT